MYRECFYEFRITFLGLWHNTKNRILSCYTFLSYALNEPYCVFSFDKKALNSCQSQVLLTLTFGKLTVINLDSFV